MSKVESIETLAVQDNGIILIDPAQVQASSWINPRPQSFFEKVAKQFEEDEEKDYKPNTKHFVDFIDSEVEEASVPKFINGELVEGVVNRVPIGVVPTGETDGEGRVLYRGIYGQCRWFSATYVEGAVLQAVEYDVETEEALLWSLSLRTNTEHDDKLIKKLSKAEECETMYKLAYGKISEESSFTPLSHDLIAQAVGRSPSYVQKFLAPFKLPMNPWEPLQDANRRAELNFDVIAAIQKYLQPTSKDAKPSKADVADAVSKVRKKGRNMEAFGRALEGKRAPAWKCEPASHVTEALNVHFENIRTAVTNLPDIDEWQDLTKLPKNGQISAEHLEGVKSTYTVLGMLGSQKGSKEAAIHKYVTDQIK